MYGTSQTKLKDVARNKPEYVKDKPTQRLERHLGHSQISPKQYLKISEYHQCHPLGLTGVWCFN